MNLQEDIINILNEKETDHVDVLMDFISEIEDNRISNRNANDRLMDSIERIVIKEQRNDN